MLSEQTIIGAGPIGLFLGSKIKDSTIIDSKERIGKPIRCTGILTKQIQQFLTQKELKEITLNKINETKVIGPNSQLQTKIQTDYIINNSVFEELLYDKTLKNNNNIILHTNYLGTKDSITTIKSRKTRKEQELTTKHIIGADGPYSLVAREHKLQPVHTRYTGLQVRMKVKSQENKILFYPHIGVYAWYVPEDEHHARVGLASASKHPQQEFNTFLKRFSGRIIEKQAGILPLHKPFRKTSNKKATLLGDAAGQVKNTTGGGIITGIKAVENYIANKQRLPLPHKQLQKELYSHFLVHNAFKTASNKEWDEIITKLNKSKEISQHNRDELWFWGPKMMKKSFFIKYGTKKILQRRLSLR